MHAGRLDTNTKAGTLYRIMASRMGEWIPGPELARLAHTDALSTRISEVRHGLRTSERHEVERIQIGQSNYYRVREKQGQMALC